MHLKKEYNEKVNHKYVLTKAQLFFNQQEEAIQSDYTPEDIKNASQLGKYTICVNLSDKQIYQDKFTSKKNKINTQV